MNVTAYDIAERFLGVKEAPGTASNPLVLAMLKLDAGWASSDDVPWCSAFVNFIAWLLNLPRSHSLAARSWLKVGMPVNIEDAKRGFDLVILQRGTGPQPGPTVFDAPGHVGFFAGYDDHMNLIRILGGNQGDAVTLQTFPAERLLGIRRLFHG